MRKKGKLLVLFTILVALWMILIFFNHKVLANTGIQINNANFPDSNFVSSLKEMYPSYTKDNLLTIDEIAKITSMDLSMMGIKDLTGIEHFTQLSFLNLEVNNLVNVDLSKNHKLTTLEISNNQLLTSLKLPKSIVNVYMNFNTQLTNFEISEYPNLKLFYGADVPLKQVDVSNLTELVALDLENTGIQRIDVTNQTKLEYLNVSSNQLEELDVSKNINLLTLRVKNNKLTKLSLPNSIKNDATVKYYEQQVEDGYQINWYDGEKLLKENENISMKGQTLTATISAKPYQIIYHANGGSGSMASEQVSFGSSINLKANTFTRTGYIFLGWSTSQNANSTTYEDKAEISFASYPNKGRITLYAVWKPIQYSIEFIDQYGEGNMEKMDGLLYGKIYRLSSNRFQREGYTFKGWSLKQGSQIVNYTNQSSFSNLTNKDGETIVLYAQWEKIKKNFSIRTSDVSVIYNGKAHTISLNNIPTGSTIYYRTSQNGTWSKTKPTRTSVGSTTVYYKVTNEDYITVEGSAKITITSKNIKNLSISSISNKTYTGKQIKPSVTVKDGKTVLKNGTHYSISYGTNKNTGKGYVKITGKGNYTGTITKYFFIIPKTPSVSISAGRGSISITAKSTGVSGYEIFYSTSRNGKYKTIRTTNSKRTISKLTRRKNYYIKVRAYKIIDGKRVYSNFSSVRVIKVK